MSNNDTAGSVAAGAAPTAPATNWLTTSELIALGAIWGASFLFMRVSAKDFGAFALAAIWVSGSARYPGAVPLARARSQFSGALWLRLAGIAAINSAVPLHSVHVRAAERAPAGIGAITNAMAVPFTAMVALLFVVQLGRAGHGAPVLGFHRRAGARERVVLEVAPLSRPAALAGATAALR